MITPREHATAHGPLELGLEGSSIGLIRLRLSLVVLSIAIVSITFGAFAVWAVAKQQDGADSRALIVLALGSFAVALAARVATRIVRSARELEDGKTRLRREYEWARLESLRDPLTGLGNHRAFQEELDRQIDQAQRYESNVALVVLDLDEFKSVNDSRGHVGGDQVLWAMGRLMMGAIRRSDRAFRIGGDEFAVIMPNSEAPTAAQAARRLLAAALEGNDGRGVTPFSFCAGVTAYPDPSLDRHQVYRHADAALYWGKQHGRTSVHVFDPARHGTAGDSRTTAELSAAVGAVARSRSLGAAYQPIFDLRSGAVLGFEGLVRPIGGSEFSDTGSLFRAAEATGRTVELDLACLRVVAGATRRGLNGYLSMNISPRTLETEEFSPALLLDIFAENGLAAERVILELTERETVEDIDRLRRNLEACQKAGMLIAADDVGAGNAGLRLLSQIRFDIVKIDLSLVQGGILRDSSLAVLRSLGEIAHSWKAMVIAEGIETAEQLEVVRSLGMTAAQGYLLAMPSTNLQVEPVDFDLLIKLEMERSPFLTPIQRTSSSPTRKARRLRKPRAEPAPARG
jgi:diguanylate cyclase (GGDEF)-like protein